MPWEELDEEYGGSWYDFIGDMDGQVTPVLEGAIEDLEDGDYVSGSFGMLGGLAAAAGAKVDFATELVGDRVDGVLGELGWAVGAGVGYYDKDAGQYVEDAFDLFGDAIGWQADVTGDLVEESAGFAPRGAGDGRRVPRGRRRQRVDCPLPRCRRLWLGHGHGLGGS